MLLSATAGLGAALGVPAAARTASAAAGSQQPGHCSTPSWAVARTQYGKVRGYLDGGVLTFKGVPYGQNTGGENRWLPARPPPPWEGERPTLVYGANCPQTLHDFTAVEQSFLQQWVDGYLSEDMLKLNIWTPSLTGRRPVMFYIHGGGFSFGSSYELAAHEGAQMARHHDVVQVSVNHRLNALGFLDLSEIGGEAYAESANVGMTDLVAALRWVRDNIANFGGDPDNVMIYGQSGGGSKVTTLMGMPAAAGLFHRAAVQSGGGGNPPSGEQARAFSRQTMVELGLQPNDIDSLRRIDWAMLNRAGNAAMMKLNPAGRGFGIGSAPDPNPRVGWAPILDGRTVTQRAFFETAPAMSKGIPLLIGSVSEEGNRMSSRPTEAQWQESLTHSLGADKAKALMAALIKAHPHKSIRTLSYAVGGIGQRNNVQRMAAMQHALQGASVFQYYFTWQSPMLEDAGAWHTAELAFCFDNTERCKQGTGNTPEAQALAHKMASAWATFARTGNPSQAGLNWTATDPVRGQTMVFDNECRMVDDPEGPIRRILLS
ncbi:MAG TPA: carboxylesterase family protein [Steroidobacteraceae bacterium]|nr:carboxylesterase family protein [Steroidobacteraceae bacterium]